MAYAQARPADYVDVKDDGEIDSNISAERRLRLKLTQVRNASDGGAIPPDARRDIERARMLVPRNVLARFKVTHRLNTNVSPQVIETVRARVHHLLTQDPPARGVEKCAWYSLQFMYATLGGIRSTSISQLMQVNIENEIRKAITNDPKYIDLVSLTDEGVMDYIRADHPLIWDMTAADQQFRRSIFETRFIFHQSQLSPAVFATGEAVNTNRSKDRTKLLKWIRDHASSGRLEFERKFGDFAGQLYDPASRNLYDDDDTLIDVLLLRGVDRQFKGVLTTELEKGESRDIGEARKIYTHEAADAFQGQGASIMDPEYIDERVEEAFGKWRTVLATPRGDEPTGREMWMWGSKFYSPRFLAGRSAAMRKTLAMINYRGSQQEDQWKYDMYKTILKNDMLREAFAAYVSATMAGGMVGVGARVMTSSQSQSVMFHQFSAGVQWKHALQRGGITLDRGADSGGYRRHTY